MAGAWPQTLRYPATLRQLHYVWRLLRRRWRHVERLAAALQKKKYMVEDDLRPFASRRGLRYPRRFLIESERLNTGRYAFADPAVRAATAGASPRSESAR